MSSPTQVSSSSREIDWVPSILEVSTLIKPLFPSVILYLKFWDTCLLSIRKMDTAMVWNVRCRKCMNQLCAVLASSETASGSKSQRKSESELIAWDLSPVCYNRMQTKQNQWNNSRLRVLCLLYYIWESNASIHSTIWLPLLERSGHLGNDMFYWKLWLNTCLTIDDLRVPIIN